MIRAYVRHIRAAQLCVRGGRAFATKYGLDWAEFLKNGIPVETLEATGDSFALKVVEIARAEHGVE